MRLGPILVVGGYGTFGARAVRHLARLGVRDIVIAGRDVALAGRAAVKQSREHGIEVSAMAFDAEAPDAAALARLGPSVVLNASGPFQSQSYALARAAIAAGVHYVDLADARAFVEGITALDADARGRDVLVAAGASSVPALSGAVIEALQPRFGRLESVSIGIAPANGFDPGIATTRAVLSGLGRPMPTLRDGGWRTVHGWQDLWRHEFPGLGRRWMANCDVPDLTVLPARYPELATVRFSAGVEVPAMHLSMWCLSWLVRSGLLPSLEWLARPLLWLKRRLSFLGSDAGGMFVTLRGTGPGGAPAELRWHLIARSNHGPYVPPAPAAILAARLARGEVSARGATACVGLVRLAEIEALLGDLDITFQYEAA